MTQPGSGPFAEDDYLPIRAVQRFAFCERQAYLRHREGEWGENRFTVEGSLVHKRVVEGEPETRPGVRVLRSVALVCHRLGITGVADVVELRGDGPVPIEYKRGKVTRRIHEHVQLGLQALCLEEMLGVDVGTGYVFHAASRRREEVVIDAALRERIEDLVSALRASLACDRAPAAVLRRHCDACSLIDVCLPGLTGPGATVTPYLERGLA